MHTLGLGTYSVDFPRFGSTCVVVARVLKVLDNILSIILAVTSFVSVIV